MQELVAAGASSVRLIAHHDEDNTRFKCGPALSGYHIEAVKTRYFAVPDGHSMADGGADSSFEWKDGMWVKVVASHNRDKDWSYDPTHAPMSPAEAEPFARRTR